MTYLADLQFRGFLRFEKGEICQSILICCVGKWAALKHGIRNPKTETESWKRKRKRNTESNINDSKLKNFTLHNLSTIEREFVSVFLAVPLNIFLLLCVSMFHASLLVISGNYD